MSMNFKTLSELPEDELLRMYDENAKNTCVGINYYMEEITRRRNEKSNKLMIRLTKWITLMTAIMLLCTIANVIFVILK